MKTFTAIKSKILYEDFEYLQISKSPSQYHTNWFD